MQVAAEITETGGIKLVFFEGALLAAPIIDPSFVDRFKELLDEAKPLALVQQELHNQIELSRTPERDSTAPGEGNGTQAARQPPP